MPKRSSILNNAPVDHQVSTESLSSLKREKNPAAVALGRLGGLKGGKARAASLSEKRRKDIAKRAAAARWKGKASLI